MASHHEASEPLDLNKLVTPPTLRTPSSTHQQQWQHKARQQTSSHPVLSSTPGSRSQSDFFAKRAVDFRLRQLQPPSQPRMDPRGLGSMPPMRYRLLVPRQLANPLLGPGGGIAECVRANSGATISISDPMIGENFSAPLFRVTAARGAPYRPKP